MNQIDTKDKIDIEGRAGMYALHIVRMMSCWQNHGQDYACERIKQWIMQAEKQTLCEAVCIIPGAPFAAYLCLTWPPMENQ
jgi:hypothetical protein